MAKVETWANIVSSYVDGVMDERIVVGKLVRAAVERYIDDLEHAPTRGFVFDEELATSMIDRFPIMLKHTTSTYAGRPFEPYPFQAFFLWQLFGWRKKSDGMRRFRDAFYSVARGNGKSPFAAAILVVLFVADMPREANSECYCLATKRDQAKIVYRDCRAYIESNDALSEYCTVYQNHLQLPDGSRLEPLASDSNNTDGLRIHGVVRDELHAWREQHRELQEKVDTAMGKRPQPLSITITTAGNDESDLWHEAYSFSSDVALRNIVADSHLSLIYESDEDDDPLDEALWPKANPMLEHGVVKIDYLRDEAAKAKDRPERLLAFKRYHTNRFVASATKVISHELWQMGASDLPELAGKVCFGGLDWGYRDDLAALARVFPIEYTTDEGETVRKYALDVDVWVPRYGKRDLHREPWAGWVERGLLRVTEGDTTDIHAIYSRLQQCARMYDVRSVAFDPHGLPEFAVRAEEMGIETYGFQQNYAKYNGPLLELLRSLTEGRIMHGNNELLGWCARNLAAKTNDAGHMMPSKSRSQDKIDPIVAALMALSEALYFSESTYENVAPGFI